MGFPAVLAFDALYGEYENTFRRFDGTVVVTMADETAGHAAGAGELVENDGFQKLIIGNLVKGLDFISHNSYHNW